MSPEWKAKKLAEDPDYFRRMAREWARKNKDLIRERRLARVMADPEAERERQRRYAAKWKENNPEGARESIRTRNARRREKTREWMRANADGPKLKANSLLNSAVRRGKIVKPSVCSDCKQDTPRRRLHGHHEDYSKPYDVVWLCAACHGKRHYGRGVKYAA